MPCYRFLLIDNHPLIRVSLRQIIESRYETCEIKEATSPDKLVRAVVKKAKPHLIIFDLQTPHMRGFSGLLQVRARCPKSRILILTENAEQALIRRCLTIGVSGFISKAHSICDIRAAITAVLAGKQWLPADYDSTIEDDPHAMELAKRLKTLSPQQQRIFAMIREGLLNKQIAYELGIRETTVKAHVSDILGKIGAKNRTHAVSVTTPMDFERSCADAGCHERLEASPVGF